MRILITGGAGFIGSHSAEFIAAYGHKVLVVDDFSTGSSKNLEIFQGKVQVVDILEYNAMDEVFYNFLPDAVLHLAAQSAITTAINDPQKDLTVNGIGTLNMVKLALKHNVRRFVFSSTSAVYSEKQTVWKMSLSEKSDTFPSTPYGISKLAAEHYIRTMFPNHMILRYGNVYGPRQKPIGDNQLIARAFRHLLFGDDFRVVGDGNQKRDFVYVDDIAYCNFMALMSGMTGTFNACTGRSRSVNQVLACIEECYELPSRYNWEHTEKSDPRGDVHLSPRQLRNQTGWASVWALKDGMKLTAEWWDRMI